MVQMPGKRQEWISETSDRMVGNRLRVITATITALIIAIILVAVVYPANGVMSPLVKFSVGMETLLLIFMFLVIFY